MKLITTYILVVFVLCLHHFTFSQVDPNTLKTRDGGEFTFSVTVNNEPIVGVYRGQFVKLKDEGEKKLIPHGHGAIFAPDSSTLIQSTWNLGVPTGACTLNAGTFKFKGTLKDGKFSDYGTIEYYGNQGISSYIGNFENNLPIGKGKLTYPNGDEYNGEIDQNFKRNGQGILAKMNGYTYDGEWLNDLENGQGSALFSGGNKFVGQWKNGKPFGKGLFNYADGKVYNGELMDGEPGGIGVMTYTTGDVYSGNWLYGKFDGVGTMKYASGEFYQGDWKSNKKQGNGFSINLLGDTINGVWINNQLNGQATIRYKNGDVYVGNVIGMTKQGRGKYDWAIGNSYDGEWEDNIQRGEGTMRWNTGEVYEGEWDNNLPHGTGIKTYADGKIEQGKFEQGTFLKGNFKSQAWFLANLGIFLDEGIFTKSQINYFEGITYSLSPSISDLIFTEEYLTNFTDFEQETKPGSIRLKKYDDDYSKIILISSNYIILSYHLTSGSSKEMTIIDLKSNTSWSDDYFATGFKSSQELMVEYDYYDDIHIFETGSYNINTKNYKVLSRE
jgi:hypothetical protein